MTDLYAGIIIGFALACCLLVFALAGYMWWRKDEPYGGGPEL